MNSRPGLGPYVGALAAFSSFAHNLTQLDSPGYHDPYWDKSKKEIKSLKGMSAKEIGTSNNKKKSRSQRKRQHAKKN